ncbi:hypothetical protein Cmtc_29360 [Cupriavidus sp. TKC]|nr:hypothetical protein Cmtc_29360 [Cupriavidus sp. TKC]
MPRVTRLVSGRTLHVCRRPSYGKRFEPVTIVSRGHPGTASASHLSQRAAWLARVAVPHVDNKALEAI